MGQNVRRWSHTAQRRRGDQEKGRGSQEEWKNRLKRENCFLRNSHRRAFHSSIAWLLFFYTHIPFLLLFNASYIPSAHHVFSLDQKAKRASQAFLFVFHHGRVLIFFFLICSTADTGRVSVSRSLPVHSWIPVLFNEFMSKTRRVRQWGVSKAVFFLFPHRIWYTMYYYTYLNIYIRIHHDNSYSIQ